MKRIPSRDISGKCRGECRDRVGEGQRERQHAIEREPYSLPAENSPAWTKTRNLPPGALGGRV